MSTQSPTQETNSKSAMRFIGAREAERKVGLSRWSLWRKEAEGTFPKSLKIGSKRLWILDEIEAWMAERIAERG